MDYKIHSMDYGYTITMDCKLFHALFQFHRQKIMGEQQGRDAIKFETETLTGLTALKFFFNSVIF